MTTGGQNADEEFIAFDGIVATGVYGVAVAPEDATGALGASWHDHGLTTDAGVTRSQPVTANKRKAWQKNTPLRRTVSEAAVRFVFVLVQDSEENIGLFHGVPLVAGSLVTDPSREWPQIAFDIDRIDGDNVSREYAPKARIVEVGDQVAVSADTYGYPITIEAEYDDGIGGYTVLHESQYETVAVPTITTALPTAMAAGGIVKLVGTGFGSAISATVGGVAVLAADLDMLSPVEMYITLPAGSSGSAPIIVTNAGGASSPKAYTRT